MTTQFSGFPTEALHFLSDLAENNNREWFNAHKKQYQTYLLEPAQAFVLALGEGVQAIAPNITSASPVASTPTILAPTS